VCSLLDVEVRCIENEAQLGLNIVCCGHLHGRSAIYHTQAPERLATLDTVIVPPICPNRTSTMGLLHQIRLVCNNIMLFFWLLSHFGVLELDGTEFL